ncbi:MAG TPA: hypothetical protein VMJ92_01880 [Candidatus Limnocylindrales bacterium]|nr:hypothetical protein [Candidatus Limnocylindrales bacterium]
MSAALLRRTGAVVFSALAMFGLLLAAGAFGLGRPDRAVLYLIATAAFVVATAAFMRRERRARRAEEERLPPELRPARRTPRGPIRFPLRESLLTFAIWYAAVIGVDRAVTGATTTFTLAVIAPFAAFMLATLTIAGRHMAFRLTAEETEPSEEVLRPDE